MGSGGDLDKREEDFERPSHEAPGNHAFLLGWVQGQQSAASPVPKIDALPLGYTPYSLFLDGRMNRKRGKGEVGLEELAVQERRNIASTHGPTTTGSQL
ncbi:uncharacterized protein DS421_9g281930 [Arachis hypogaea]|nr:uncharacterized protein DS421_9g281930 [Arachis hypogaea]